MYCKSYKLCKSEAIILLMSCYPFLVLPFIHFLLHFNEPVIIFWKGLCG